MSNALSDAAHWTSNALLIVQLERDMKELEDSEKKLIGDFDKVMSNMCMLLGYIMDVFSGVSGLLSSDL